jgi:hypothetical protein
LWVVINVERQITPDFSGQQGIFLEAKVGQIDRKAWCKRTRDVDEDSP